MEMHDNSPFNDCNDDELIDIFPVLSRRVGTKHITGRMIEQLYPPQLVLTMYF